MTGQTSGVKVMYQVSAISAVSGHTFYLVTVSLQGLPGFGNQKILVCLKLQNVNVLLKKGCHETTKNMATHITG